MQIPYAMHFLLFFIISQLRKYEIPKEIHDTMKTPDRAKTQNSKLKQDTKHSTSFKE